MGTARMANVAGALVPGGAGTAGAERSSRDAAAWRARLGELLVVVTDAEGPPLDALGSTLRATDAGRLLVADPAAPVVDLEVLLGLACWPEAGVLVLVGDDGHPAAALYRVADARAKIDRVVDVPALLDALDAERVDRAALGLAEASSLREAC